MDTREFLQQRIALARPEDQILGLFFVSTLAGANELFGPEVAEAAKAALPGPQKWEGFFKYPVADLLRLTDAVAREAGRKKGLSYVQVLEQLGSLLGQGILEASFGKTYQRLTAGDVHRALAGSMSSAKASSTFGERGYEKLGPNAALLTFKNELMGSSWIRGLYVKVLQVVANAPHMGVTVEGLQAPGSDFNLRCTW